MKPQKCLAYRLKLCETGINQEDLSPIIEAPMDIRGMANRNISKVVVLYKDRLTRFGFELIEYLAEMYGCEIEVVDTTEKTEQEELVEDLVQIVTVFSCKLQGKRANKARKMIRELTEDDKDI